MHVTVYHGEKSISALARRLYEGGRADLTRAQEALLENNPRLDDLSKVAEGTTLLVPEVEGATRTEESAPLETAAASGIAAAVQEALDPVGNQLTASAAAERGRAEEALQVVKAREVKKAAEASRHLGRAVAGVQARADERETFAAALEAHAKELGELIARDVNGLLDALGRQG